MSDSIWAVVAGTVKAFNLSIDYVLYDMSYTNVILYGATLPSLKSDSNGKGKQKQQKSIKADDPKNKGAVRKFLEEVE